MWGVSPNYQAFRPDQPDLFVVGLNGLIFQKGTPHTHPIYG